VISMPGGWEWIIILVVALLIFGKRLPEVARAIGKAMTEFRKGMDDIRNDVQTAVYESEREDEQKQLEPPSADSPDAETDVPYEADDTERLDENYDDYGDFEADEDDVEGEMDEAEKEGEEESPAEEATPEGEDEPTEEPAESSAPEPQKDDTARTQDSPQKTEAKDA